MTTHTRTRDRDFDLQFDAFRCANGYTPGDLNNVPQKDVQRVTEIYESPHFFPKGGAITSNAIAQGYLGDCYFLAALATVSSFPSLIEKICVAVSAFFRLVSPENLHANFLEAR
jgi:Calpain family cysteine protease